MPYRLAFASVALVMAFGLAACNASMQPSMNASAYADASAAAGPNPPDYHLPSGEACTADINRYATIVYGDNQTGMVSPSVFKDIRSELVKAADACRAGHDAEARSLVSASQREHGYPPSA